MMRIAWCTDIHLNFLEPDQVAAFCHALAEGLPHAVLVTGDISESYCLDEHLGMLEEHLGLPIYFVLGNHDYYRGSIATVRREVRDICARSERLRWLSESGVIPLSEEAALIGHDGWADGRLGDFLRSHVMLNDYLHIEELAFLSKRMRLERLHALGDEAADALRPRLAEALERFAHVLVATHVPPFREACWHEGAISNDDWLPHFSCRAVGDVLAAAMRERPDRRMTVLCGHTHGEGTATPLPNLTVYTGAAEYGAPRLA